MTNDDQWIDRVLHGHSSYSDRQSEYEGREYDFDEAKSIIKAKMLEARIEELKWCKDNHKITGNDYDHIQDRLTELQALSKLIKGEES